MTGSDRVAGRPNLLPGVGCGHFDRHDRQIHNFFLGALWGGCCWGISSKKLN